MKRFGTFCALTALLLVTRTNLASAAGPADFLGPAVECNTFEKEMAQKAAENATNEDVKKFAQRLAEDHTNFEKELLQLVKDKKVGVATGTNKEHRDKLAELAKTPKGADYDKKYLAFVVDEHEKAIRQVEACAKDNAQDAGCRACAEKALPTLRKHLEEARALQKKLGG